MSYRMPYKRRYSSAGAGTNDSYMDSSYTGSSQYQDQYKNMMGVSRPLRKNIMKPYKKLAAGGRNSEQYDEKKQMYEEHSERAWARGSVRPPNRFILRLKCCDAVSANPTTSTTVFQKTKEYYANSLYEMSNGSGANDIRPFLDAYTNIWNRAIVMYTKYSVTIQNLKATPFRALIGFQPFGQTFTTGTWAIFDQQVNSDANREWVKTEQLGPNTLPQGMTTIQMGKYLPSTYGDVSQYLGQLDSGGSTVDFSQAVSAPGTISANPTTKVSVLIGVIALTATTVDTQYFHQVKQTQTVMFFRNNLQYY